MYCIIYTYNRFQQLFIKVRIIKIFCYYFILIIITEIGCTNVLDNISHGKLIVVNDAKLEIECDVGYVINGPSFTFCNEDNEWNDELKGCRG